jgi:hypothetical protein
VAWPEAELLVLDLWLDQLPVSPLEYLSMDLLGEAEKRDPTIIGTLSLMTPLE